MKASYSFVLALLSCATPTLLANSPASNKAQKVPLVSVEISSANTFVAARPVAPFRLPSGAGSYSPHVRLGINECGACSLIPSSATIASNATEVTEIQALAGWQEDPDSATSGAASGTTGTVSAPALSADARQFEISYSNSGGERFYATFGADMQATHFFYDGWVYIASPSNDVANLEMDINQVMANGQTVIFGVQCDGYSSTWDYTGNQGTPENPSDVWLHSTASCNPRNWATNAWHHVQMSYSRDDGGNVTYESVWLDDAEQNLNVTVPSAFALGWGSVLLTNFEVDGLGASGSATVYLDNLSVYRW